MTIYFELFPRCCMREGAGGWSIDAALIAKARGFARPRCARLRGEDAEDLAQEALLRARDQRQLG